MKDRIEQYHEKLATALHPQFIKANLKFPPSKVLLVFFKENKALQLFAQNEEKQWVFIKSYPVTMASGKFGPKLKEGDLQVPEGIYKVESLNPNSLFHLSLRLNYPNSFDKAKGRLDNRTLLGSNIMIHGGSSSIGCIAIGDEAIEELFTLAGTSNYQAWEIVIAPYDFRKKSRILNNKTPIWINELDALILQKLQELP